MKETASILQDFAVLFLAALALIGCILFGNLIVRKIMKSFFVIALLLSPLALRAQTRDTVVQWRYDSMRNTQYAFSVGAKSYVVPARDSFLYIGKDVPNADSVYRAQTWSRAVELKRYIGEAKK